MSTDDICETKPVITGNSSDSFFQENKRIKCETGEASTSFLNSEAEDELLQKYKKISTSELEDICERLMYYDSTGVYKPPKQNNQCLCPKKKQYYINQHSRPRSNNEKIETQFGQGSVGVATERCGHRSTCHCCVNNFGGSQTHLVHPSNNVVCHNSHLPSGKRPLSQDISEMPQVKVKRSDKNCFGSPSEISSDNVPCNSDSFNCNSISGAHNGYLMSQTDLQSNANSKTSLLQSASQLFGTQTVGPTNVFLIDSAIINCDNNNRAPQSHVMSQKDSHSFQNSINSNTPVLQCETQFSGASSGASTSTNNFMLHSASCNSENNFRNTPNQIILEKGSQTTNSVRNCHANSGDKMADSLPSTSASQVQTDAFQNNPVFSNEELDQFSAFLDNTNVLDLSVSNLNRSDSSDTIYYSEDSSTSLLNDVVPPPEAEGEPIDLSNDLEAQSAAQNLTQDDISVISVSNVTAGSENNTEVIDLTNYTQMSDETLQLLDETFQRLNPPCVGFIDLVSSDDSSDDDESIKLPESFFAKSPKSTKRKSNSFECPICFEPLKYKKIMTTICGHIFCSGCIKSSIRQKKCCPTCRKRLRSDGYHPLFLPL